MKLFSKVNVWKSGNVIMASFLHNKGCTTLCLNRHRESNDEINSRIRGWAVKGHEVIVGVPYADVKMLSTRFEK